MPFAPLTAATILITGVLWTRWLQPSAVESIVALIGVELFTWGVVRFFAGEWWSFFVFAFWGISSVIFAPWWLFGFGLGGGLRRNRA